MARALDKDFNEVYKVQVLARDPERPWDTVTYIWGPYASPDVAREIRERATYRMKMQGWEVVSDTIFTSGEVEWAPRFNEGTDDVIA